MEHTGQLCQSSLLFAAAFLVLCTSMVSCKECDRRLNATYVAAVVEFSPELGVTKENARQRFQENVAAFVEYAQEAKRLGAEIVVFPECGLATLELPREADGAPTVALRVAAVGANPCAEGDDHPQELRELSCAARDAAIYVVVNLPEEEPCAGEDEGVACGAGGRRFFNTDVAFDRRGAVVAKYRKYNLYGEDGFVPTAKPTLAFFDADFGVRFGLFTCFDLMFERPAVALVSEAGVSDVVFPTAWFSELPFLTAVQAQASWARALDVNFLGAGYNLPAVGSTGSGLYAGRRGVVVAVMEHQRTSKLLVGRLPVRDACDGAAASAHALTGVAVPLARRAREQHVPEAEATTREERASGLYGQVTSHLVPQTERGRPLEQSCEADELQPKKEPLVLTPSGPSTKGDNAFLYLKTEDLDKYVTLLMTEDPKLEVNGTFDVCHGEFCCRFEVISARASPFRDNISRGTEEKSGTLHSMYGDAQGRRGARERAAQGADGGAEQYHYRLMAFDGRRSFDGIVDGGLQVCGVMACASPALASCARLRGSSVPAPATFRKVRVHGRFHRPHALPLPSTLDAALMPLPGDAFALSVSPVTSDEADIVLENITPVAFLTFGIYSRDFGNDP